MKEPSLLRQKRDKNDMPRHFPWHHMALKNKKLRISFPAIMSLQDLLGDEMTSENVDQVVVDQVCFAHNCQGPCHHHCIVFRACINVRSSTTDCICKSEATRRSRVCRIT